MQRFLTKAVKSLLVGSVLISFAFVSAIQADARYKPFFLASQTAGDKAEKMVEVKKALTSNGFEIVGEYTPYPAATIFVVTNDAIKTNAANSGDDDDKLGGFGAAQRVAVTEANNEIQVSYTNPLYMHYVYNLKDVKVAKEAKEKLSLALGLVKAYGSEEGEEADDLKDYQYAPMQSEFDDPDELSKHSSYEAAIKATEAALAAQKGGVRKVYRIDLPGKNQTLYGVAMTKKWSSDVAIMKEIDFGKVKSSAHLPYEMLVVNNKVYALNASFRIAISFPDLSMMGDNSFMNIMDSPDDIEDALTLASGGTP